MAKQPINPEILAWSIETSGLDVPTVAASTKRSVSAVESWLAGEAPNRGDVERLARLFGRSKYFFNLPTPPQVTEPLASFRYLSEDPGEHGVELAEIRWARSIQHQMEILLRDEGVEKPPDYSREDSAEAAAAKARGWLNWTTTDQRTATSKTAMFKSLRRAVENREIAVTLRSAGESSFAGFSLPSQIAPLIYLNKDYELGSLRSFTLLHELAHVTRRDAEFCDEGRFWSETWCNRFASAFLLPATDVRTYFDRAKLAFVTSSDVEPVRRVANYFRVSWAAAAVRLERLGLAPAGLATLVISTRPEPPGDGFSPSGGLRTYQLRLEEFGRHYTGTMLAAASDERLHSADLKRRLSVREDQLPALRSAVFE